MAVMLIKHEVHRIVTYGDSLLGKGTAASLLFWVAFRIVCG